MTSDANGTYRGVYTYGLDRIAERDLAAVEGVPNDPLYYLYDGRGSVTQLVNTENHVRDKYRYTPFGVPMPGGQLTPNTRLFNNPYGYNGEDYDIESGLQFLRARYYNPETARFISRDSYLGDVMEPLSLNRYAYTSNNPVMNIDPSGHTSKNLKPTLQKNLTYNANTERLQQMLVAIGYNDLDVDGKFGDQTDAAVRDFQRRANIGVDGIVGNITWAKLEEVYNNIQSTGIVPGNITIPRVISATKKSEELKDKSGNTSSSSYVEDKKGSKPSYNKNDCGNNEDIKNDYVYDPKNWANELNNNIKPLINIIPTNITDEQREIIVDAIILSEAKKLQDKYRTAYTASDNILSNIFSGDLHENLRPLYEQYSIDSEEKSMLVQAIIGGSLNGIYAGIWSAAFNSKVVGNGANKISKSDLFSNYEKVEDKLKTLKDPNGNYARMAKELGYDNFNIDSWKKGIQSFKADGVRIEYHFVKNIEDGTVIGEKIFRVIDGIREYLDILP